jgi:CHAT domain-containing protein
VNNLDLLLSSSTEARIIASPQGRSPAPAPVNSPILQPSNFPSLDSLNLARLQPLGLNLFNALTADSGLRDLFIANLTAASVDNAGLRLRLQIDPPDLRRLPWEAMYRDPVGFLALRDLSIARYIAVGTQLSKPVVTQLPLKILIASASPSELPKLNLAAERDNLTQALADEAAKGWVQLDFLEHAQRQNLRDKLLAFRPHVFHFSGHGQFKDDKASLAFEDSYGDTDPIPPDAAALLFGGLPELRLIVLNACETAIDSTARPLTGIAPKLLQQAGIPAVVAMQAPILDRAAIAFSRAFYNQLAEGQTIDTALREARLSIYNTVTNSADFVVPVLFIATDEGTLIEFPQQIKARVTTQARKGFESIQSAPATALTTSTLNRWQINLRLAAGFYKKIAAWKNLHDILHDLNEAMEFVALEIPRLDKTDPDFSFIADHWARCQTVIRELTDFARAGAAAISTQPFTDSSGTLSGDPWIVETLIAARTFDSALTESTLKAVTAANRKVRQAIQTHMNAADKQIQDVTADLRRTTDRWSDSLPSTPELATAITELDRLHKLLYNAVEKHEGFQDLDNDFARLRDEVRRGFDWEALNAAWAFCRSDVLDSRLIPFAKKNNELSLANGAYTGSEWCVEIARLADSLDTQIAAEEQTAVRNTIRQLGTAIRTHFFIADKELKELTTTLDALSDDLLGILK